MDKLLINFLETKSIPFDQNISLKKISWIKRGGISDFFITPTSSSQFKDLVFYLRKSNFDFEIIGNTSNIYFLDTYNPHVVISTTKLNHFFETEDSIVCECGTNVSKMARLLSQKGYEGFYGLVNLPGTIGSAVVNNASCFGCSISDLLISIKCIPLDSNDDILTLSALDLKYSHRSSSIKRQELRVVVLSITLKKRIGNPELESQKASAATEKRQQTQEKPAFTLGSVYSNLILRNNFKNLISRCVVHFINGHRRMYIYKKVQLFLYGYGYLDKYISDKNFNTFIWKGDQSVSMFLKYQELMNLIYLNPTLEIEIRK